MKNKKGQSSMVNKLITAILVALAVGFVIYAVIYFSNSSFFKNLPFFGSGNGTIDINNPAPLQIPSTYNLDFKSIKNSGNSYKVELKSTGDKDLRYYSLSTQFLTLNPDPAIKFRNFYYRINLANSEIDIHMDYQFTSMGTNSNKIVVGRIDKDGRVWIAEDLIQYGVLNDILGLQNCLTWYVVDSPECLKNSVKLVRNGADTKISLYASDLQLKDVEAFRQLLR
jgi:hypothetical protein